MLEPNSTLLGSIEINSPFGSPDLYCTCKTLPDLPLVTKLQEGGLKECTIRNLGRCGKDVTYLDHKDDTVKTMYITSTCDCGENHRVIKLRYRCNNRICPSCAKRRQREFFSKYLHYFDNFENNDYNRFRFLTISPVNELDLKVGLDKLQRNFRAFIRRDYFRNRVKGGMYVIECKVGSDGLWNIHLHSLIYGSYLDNRVRGRCYTCDGKSLKFEPVSGKFRCASKYCRSYDVVQDSDSKLVSEWKKVSNEDVNIDIRQQRNSKSALYYCLKYISNTKQELNNNLDYISQYLITMHNRRLLSFYGCFHNNKIKKQPRHCSMCGSEITYIFDMSITEQYNKNYNDNPPPQRTIYDYSRDLLYNQ